MDEMTSDSVLEKLSESFSNALSAFKRDLQGLRTGRASPGLVEGIQVDYYGTKTALSHLAQVSTPEPRLIVIQVYDVNAIAPIEKSIQSSNLGFNPSRDGNMLRINIAPLTEEGRKNLVKVLRKMAEDMKISVRNHRRDANDTVKKLEKESELSKDDAKKVLDRIQKETDSAISEVDNLLKAKEAECMEV